jgi:hypothetical protein
MLVREDDRRDAFVPEGFIPPGRLEGSVPPLQARYDGLIRSHAVTQMDPAEPTTDPRRKAALDRERLTAELAAAASQHLKHRRWPHFWIALACALMVARMVVDQAGHAGRSSWFDWAKIAFFLSAFLCLWSGLSRRAVLTRSPSYDLRRLRGMLLDTAPDPSFAEEHSKLLALLLKEVKASDGPDFTGRRRARLRRLIRERAGRADLRLAALSALCEVADERSAEFIARIADESANSRIEKELRTRARRKLPGIRARLALAKTAGTLLRPADPPDGDTLLRPADGAPSGDEERLLRPAADGW